MCYVLLSDSRMDPTTHSVQGLEDGGAKTNGLVMEVGTEPIKPLK